jgi:6-methylsalicylate decarboxylase
MLIAASMLSVSSPGVHFGDDSAARTLARQVNDFGAGVAIESNSDGIYLGDQRYEQLYDELNERRAVVFAHPTSPVLRGRVPRPAPAHAGIHL